MRRDGVPKKLASSANLKYRFGRIFAELGGGLPFDGASWIDSAPASYNCLKHAKRIEADPVEAINAWRECVLVTRTWVAIELGVPIEQVREPLAMDPKRRAYVKVE